MKKDSGWQLNNSMFAVSTFSGEDQAGDGSVTDYTCKQLISYSGDIEKYYDALWNQITDITKTILLIIASVNFQFTEDQMIDCISHMINNAADISKGLKDIYHLIKRNNRQQIFVYHNSFDLYLKNTNELKQQIKIIKNKVKEWLEKSNYEYLNWAELKIIEYELGNSTPILEIDKPWLIDSICYPRNPEQISKQMHLATKIAFECENYGKALQVSYLHTYYLNSKEFIEEATESIWKEAIRQNDRVFDYIDYQSLPTAIFPIVAEIAYAKGYFATIEETIDILRNRLDSQDYRKNTVPPVTAALIEILTYDRSRNIENIYKYIIQFRDLGITSDFFWIYSKGLLKLGQKAKMLELLKQEFSETERQKILLECARYAWQSDTDASQYFIEQDDLPPLCRLYMKIKKGVEIKPYPLPQYNEFEKPIRELDPEQRAQWRDLFYMQFLNALIYCMIDRKEEVEEWIGSSPKLWPAQAICCLFQASIEIASEIERSEITLTILFNSIFNLNELRWPDDREILNFQNAFKDAMSLIFKDLIVIKRYFGNSNKIKIIDYATITCKPAFFSEEDLLEIVLDIFEPIFEREVYENIKKSNNQELLESIETFPERAKKYAKISKLAHLYGENDLAKSLNKKAADNLLGNWCQPLY